MFPCCHRTHYRPTLRHSWPPGPVSVSPSTGHFVSHSGVTRQLLAQPSVVTTHTRVSDIRRCSMQTPVTPGPRVFVLAVYTPSTSSSTWLGVRNIRDSVTNIRTSCAWDTGTRCHLEETKTMAAWCRECELSQMVASALSSHLWQSELLRGGGGTRSENKNATETDNSINIPLNSNRRINYQQIPLFSLCQQICSSVLAPQLRAYTNLLLSPSLTIAPGLNGSKLLNN